MRVVTEGGCAIRSLCSSSEGSGARCTVLNVEESVRRQWSNGESNSAASSSSAGHRPGVVAWSLHLMAVGLFFRQAC